MIKTPKFWSEKNFIAKLLYPISCLYYAGYKIRCFLNFSPYKSDIKVVCVGNLVAGGAGKTPVAIEIAKFLNKNGKTFCFLSKGYGAEFNGVFKLYPNSSAKDYGDEPIILRNYGDVFVAKNRVEGLKYINNNFNYDFIIVDDGLQNPTFIKDKKIIVLDGNFGFGNGYILPAGPLRDKDYQCDLAIINGEDKHNLSVFFSNYTKSKTYVNSNIDKNIEYIAFCGIARPEKFENTLKENGIKVRKFVTFGDHHSYTKKEINKLKSYGFKLITTEKDWVKIKDNDINILKINIDLDNNKLMEILL